MTDEFGSKPPHYTFGYASCHQRPCATLPAPPVWSATGRSIAIAAQTCELIFSLHAEVARQSMV